MMEDAAGPDESPCRVLVVDDEPFNLEIVADNLQDAGYGVVTAADGAAGWALPSEDNSSDAIPPDRMLPGMDGIELLKKVRAMPSLRDVPVIMQTAAGAAENVREGLAAGAYYYLVKPFQRDMLLAIVATAVDFHRERMRLERLVGAQVHCCRMLVNGDFRFRTLEDAHYLTLILSNACPDPQRVAIGLSELLVNAVEHGNLAISYEEKTCLVQQDCWEEEIERRLDDPAWRDRHVSVAFRTFEDEVCLVITDQGDGFDWERYLDFAPERVFDLHGRGIPMARMLSFDSVDYCGKGNQVVARIKRKA